MIDQDRQLKSPVRLDLKFLGIDVALLVVVGKEVEFNFVRVSHAALGEWMVI